METMRGSNDAVDQRTMPASPRGAPGLATWDPAGMMAGFFLVSSHFSDEFLTLMDAPLRASPAPVGGSIAPAILLYERDA